MKPKLASLFLLVVLVLTACSSAKNAQVESRDIVNMGAPAEAPMPQALSDKGMDGSYSELASNAGGQSSVPDADALRLVIRNADLSIVVDDPSSAMGYVNQMADRMGGYVVTSNLWKSVNYNGNEVPEASITIRVPANLLNQAIEEIEKLTNDRAVDVLSKNVSGQDVTKEYTDLNSRLKNLEDAEAQLRSILEEAKKTEDVLNVFNQLTYYREQIEVIKGQIKYYEEASTLSSISVRIQAHEAVNPITVAGWKPSVTVSKALQALVNALQVIVDALIWIVLTVLPIMVVIFLPLYLVFAVIRAIVRRSNKNRKAKKLAQSQTPSEPAEE